MSVPILCACFLESDRSKEFPLFVPPPSSIDGRMSRRGFAGLAGAAVIATQVLAGRKVTPVSHELVAFT